MSGHFHSHSHAHHMQHQQSQTQQQHQQPQTPHQPPVTRKKRRGLIEKKRRDKINLSLYELKRLVPAANDKQNSAKLEKAEILQLTVEYLRLIKAKGFDKLVAGDGDCSSSSASAKAERRASTAAVSNELLAAQQATTVLSPATPAVADPYNPCQRVDSKPQQQQTNCAPTQQPSVHHSASQAPHSFQQCATHTQSTLHPQSLAMPSIVEPLSVDQLGVATAGNTTTTSLIHAAYSQHAPSFFNLDAAAHHQTHSHNHSHHQSHATAAAAAAAAAASLYSPHHAVAGNHSHHHHTQLAMNPYHALAYHAQDATRQHASKSSDQHSAAATLYSYSQQQVEQQQPTLQPLMVTSPTTTTTGAQDAGQAQVTSSSSSPPSSSSASSASAAAAAAAVAVAAAQSNARQYAKYWSTAELASY